VILSLVLISLGHGNIALSDDTFVRDTDLKVELVAEGLKSPTSMAFLGPDDILVLEKEGKVQRIIGNDILRYPALDIINKVNSSYERGLLGIALRADEQARDEGKDDNSNMKNIYLYYTENVTNKDDADTDCLLDQCQMIDYIANRLYRYDFKDSKLVNPKLLLSIPLNDNSDYIHVGGVITIGPDNNVYLSTGDGKTCGNYEECRIIIEGGPLDSQTANIKDGVNASGRGGILYFEDDGGKVAHSKGILGEYYPLNLYYAYGIRNSFGIDFDPITGYLWDTENGPAFGDEINLVEPGFDSGWAKIQGVWPITNHSQLANDPPPGIEKGYFLPVKNKLGSYNDVVFDFDGKGKYSEPEFTWNHTVGVTSIKFFDSDKYGSDYKNDLFVGTFNGGFIYHFDLTKDRKELFLKGELLDKVANDDEELTQVVLARGFGGITDLEVSPDGYLYVVSTTEGKIWRLVT